MKWSSACILFVCLGVCSHGAQAWEYDDALNQVLISGTACRGITHDIERSLTHPPGSTTAQASLTRPARVICPLNRRNAHARSATPRELVSRLVIRMITIKVDSPSGTLRCRFFAKLHESEEVHYTEWKTPRDFNESFTRGEYIVFIFNPPESLDTYNFGLMCELPAEESIKVITMVAENNNV